MQDWKNALGALLSDEDRQAIASETVAEVSRRDGTPKNRHRLRVSMERAGRGGKTVTIVRGFEGEDEELESLARFLKQRCGVGGSVKDGEIIIQGDLRTKVIDILRKEGYTNCK
ncbi:MAG: translation initiation factor [Bacteroidaceae bacterium]|nr:translation initiation factor [Bacteroidaceae bacterium]